MKQLIEKYENKIKAIQEQPQRMHTGTNAVLLNTYRAVIEDMKQATSQIETEASELCQNISGFLPRCTRVEVIDQNGRSYVNWEPTNKVETIMQDGNRTLKVFIR